MNMNEKTDINIKNKRFNQIKIKEDIFCDCGKLLKKYRYENNLYLCCDCGEIYLPSEKALKIFNVSRKKPKYGHTILEKPSEPSGVPFFVKHVTSTRQQKQLSCRLDS
jgi:hypothetical protein